MLFIKGEIYWTNELGIVLMQMLQSDWLSCCDSGVAGNVAGGRLQKGDTFLARFASEFMKHHIFELPR